MPSAAGTRVTRGQTAQQQHRVQIDMRVEKGKCQARQHGALPALRTGLRRRQPAGATPGPACSQRTICREKCSSRIAKSLQQLRPLRHQYADPGHAQHDQRDIAERADRHHQTDMLALQSLPQHECILRTDCDDETCAGDEARDCGLK